MNLNLNQRIFFTTVKNKVYLAKLIKKNSNNLQENKLEKIEINQVHGKDILILKNSASVTNYLSSKSQAKIKPYDGIISNQSNVVLIIKHADCAPVFLFSPKAEIIGMLHCGWRSVKKGIINNFNQIIKKKFNFSQPIYFSIGPMICKKCYEVGREVVEEFENLLEQNSLNQKNYFFPKKEKYLFDLKKLIKHLCGKENFIEYSSAPECTKENPAFFSYRENKTNFRNYSFLIKKIV